MKKGEIVVVRTYGNRPEICRVWEIAPDVIYICSEENYHILVEGGEGLWPVGIPKGDVFCYDPSLDIESCKEDSKLWDKLYSYGDG